MAKHMTLEERKHLQARYAAGQAITTIAREMGFSWSTIYNELIRGSTGKRDKNGRMEYSAEIGQRNLYSRDPDIRKRVNKPPTGRK